MLAVSDRPLSQSIFSKRICGTLLRAGAVHGLAWHGHPQPAAAGITLKLLTQLLDAATLSCPRKAFILRLRFRTREWIATPINLGVVAGSQPIAPRTEPSQACRRLCRLGLPLQPFDLRVQEDAAKCNPGTWSTPHRPSIICSGPIRPHASRYEFSLRPSLNEVLKR